jgi:LPXTG-site transpeptidase (sortase) family protein
MGGITMSTQEKKRSGKRNWVTVFAITIVVIGALAVSVPLILQRINYGIAAQKAAEAESQMVIPAKNDYKPADFSSMKQGVTPTYSPEELEAAENPPGLLEELGIVGEPSSMLLPGIASAKAESKEPASMREALSLGADALKECCSLPYNSDSVSQALALVRKQVENAFFLLTQVQPFTNTETLASLSGQKTKDAVTRGDKTITAARELIYNSLTDLEELLKQVEVQTSAFATSGANDIDTEECLIAQLETLSSYLQMTALHLSEDDYKSSMAQQRDLVNLNKDAKAEDDESGYDAIDTDQKDVKRSYLLEIPEINVKVAVLRSGSFNKMYTNMRSGAAMFPRAPEPNTVGNICISAHRTGTRDYFLEINKLSVGDLIYLHTSHLGSFQYQVVKVDIIDSHDWSVTKDVGYPALTLLSCQASNGISNALRVVVRAKLVGVADGQ